VAAGPIIVQTGGRVVLRSLLFPFAVLAGYFVAWGVVFCMDALVRAFFGTAEGLVGWVPFAGRVLTSPLHAIERKLTSFLGGLEAHFENQMATRWHTLAGLLTRWAHEAQHAAADTLTLARKLAYVYGELATGRLGKRFQTWVLAQLRGLRGQTTVIVKTVTRTVPVAVGKAAGGTVARLRPIAARVEHVLDWDLPRLRARDRYLSDQVARLWKWTRAHGRQVATSIGLGALAIALGRLGLGWLRCSKVSRLGRRACGLDEALLTDLLEDTLVILGTISLVEFARELGTITNLAADGVHGLIRET